MRPRNEERNQRLWEERNKGKTFKELEKEFGLSNGRCVKIYHNQERWNAEKKANDVMTPEKAVKNLELLLESVRERKAVNIVIPEVEAALKMAIESLSWWFKMICDDCGARFLCQAIKDSGQRIKACTRYVGGIPVAASNRRIENEKPDRITTGFIMGDSGTAESRGGEE